MPKKPIVPVCSRCETPFRSETAFCRACGAPTPWATHEDRIEYEVREWRASRAATEPNKPQMMLVRTEEGFEAVPMRAETYVWDQPLHPDHPDLESPTRPAETATAVLERPLVEPAPADRNGNGNGNGHRAPGPDRYAAVEAHTEPPVTSAGGDLPPDPYPERPAMETPIDDDDDRITVSKKAVAIGLALVLGLPLGGKLLSLGGGSDQAPQAAPGLRVKAAALIASRSGFDQIAPDAVRYAVVIRNPNRSLLASGVTVRVAMHDARGRLVGVDVERIGGVPATGSIGIAGTIAVARPASRLKVSLGTSSFATEAKASRPFVVRNVKMTRSGGVLVVRSGISGTSPVHDARIVAVYLDRAGKIVAGDWTSVDVPRSPKAAMAVVATAGLRRSVSRVEIYVLPPR